MFTIISIMFVGIGIGYVLRNLQFFTENRKEYITHYLPAAVCFGNLYRFQQLNH